MNVKNSLISVEEHNVIDSIQIPIYIMYEKFITLNAMLPDSQQYIRESKDQTIFYKQNTKRNNLTSQAIRINCLTVKVDAGKQNPYTNYANHQSKGVINLVSERNILAQKECKERHDNLGRVIHQKVRRDLGYEYIYMK